MLSNKGAETLSHPRKYTIKKIIIKSTSHGRPLKYYKARRKKINLHLQVQLMTARISPTLTSDSIISLSKL